MAPSPFPPPKKKKKKKKKPHLLLSLKPGIKFCVCVCVRGRWEGGWDGKRGWRATGGYVGYVSLELGKWGFVGYVKTSNGERAGLLLLL